MTLIKEFFNDPPLKLSELKELSKKDRDELIFLIKRYYENIAAARMRTYEAVDRAYAAARKVYFGKQWIRWANDWLKKYGDL